MNPLTLVAAVGLALTHLLGARLRFLDAIPRNRWLSFGGGVSVAYVFIHILPELEAHQRTIESSELLPLLEDHLYLVAMIGLTVFYGLERAVRGSQSRETQGSEETPSGMGVFWLHIGSFALYNALVGYLLTEREQTSTLELFLFVFALGLHFIINDFGLRKDHRRTYDRLGRWVLAASILIGWGLSLVIELDERAVALLFAFLAGSIVLNVLKEELPEERKSRFGAFAFGVLFYAALLVAVA